MNVTKTEQISNEKLAKLSKDPKNLVYKYEFDKPERIVPVSEVKGWCDDILRLMPSVKLELKRRQLEVEKFNPKVSDVEELIFQFLPHVREMKKSHPTIWAAVSHPNTTKAQLDHLYKMLWLKHQHENEGMQKEIADATVSAYLMEQFRLPEGTDQTEYEIVNRPIDPQNI